MIFNVIFQIMQFFQALEIKFQFCILNDGSTRQSIITISSKDLDHQPKKRCSRSNNYVKSTRIEPSIKFMIQLMLFYTCALYKKFIKIGFAIQKILFWDGCISRYAQNLNITRSKIAFANFSIVFHIFYTLCSFQPVYIIYYKYGIVCILYIMYVL